MWNGLRYDASAASSSCAQNAFFKVALSMKAKYMCLSGSAFGHVAMS